MVADCYETKSSEHIKKLLLRIEESLLLFASHNRVIFVLESLDQILSGLLVTFNVKLRGGSEPFIFFFKAVFPSVQSVLVEYVSNAIISHQIL